MCNLSYGKSLAIELNKSDGSRQQTKNAATLRGPGAFNLALAEIASMSGRSRSLSLCVGQLPFCPLHASLTFTRR